MSVRPRSLALRLPLLASLALFPLACGDAPDEEAAEAAAAAPLVDSVALARLARDSAGPLEAVVESGAPAWAGGGAWTVGSTPTLTIAPGPGEAAFERVTSLVRLSDGSVVLSDARGERVHRFDASGRHRASLAGPAEGTSFRSPGALTPLGGDSVLLQDRGESLVLGPDLRVVRRQPAPLAVILERTGRSGSTTAPVRLPDGRLLLALEPETGPATAARPLRRDSLTLLVFDAQATYTDTLGRFGGWETQVVEGPGGAPTAVVPPLARTTVWALAPDGAVFVADGARPEIVRFAPDGSRSTWRWAASPRPVTAADLEAWKAARRANPRERGWVDALEAVWGSLDLPETHPYVQRLVPARDGGVWALTDAGEASRASGTGAGETWTVFAPDGRWLGDVTLPGGFVLHEVGDGWLLGHQARPDGPGEVVQYPLQK